MGPGEVGKARADLIVKHSVSQACPLALRTYTTRLWRLLAGPGSPELDFSIVKGGRRSHLLLIVWDSKFFGINETRKIFSITKLYPDLGFKLF